MTKRQKQIELLENRLDYLRTIDKLLRKDASFSEIASFVTSEDNEDVSDNNIFLQELVRLMKMADDFTIELDDEDNDYDE